VPTTVSAAASRVEPDAITEQGQALLTSIAAHVARVCKATDRAVIVDESLAELASAPGDDGDRDARFTRGAQLVVPFHGGAVQVLGGRQPEEPELLETLAQIASAVVQADRATQRLRDGATRAIEALAALLALRDGYAERDATFMADLTVALGRRLGLDDARCRVLRAAARVHDLGKIGVPDRVLHKAGKLAPDERMIMQRHPVWGAEILERIPGLEGVATIVRAHHERWDGGGYPVGLAGDDIPLEASAIGAAEALRALTSERPYRRSMSSDQALAIVAANAGRAFAPAVVMAVLAEYAARGIEPAEPRHSGAAEPASRRGVLGVGHRLPEAFARVEALPALSESRDRLVAALSSGGSRGTIVGLIESDPALLLALLRTANARPGLAGRVGTVPDALDVLADGELEELVAGIAVTDLFATGPGGPAPERLRLHGSAVQRVASRIAHVLHRDDDELLVAAMLHDVGKLVLAHAYPGYPDEQHRGALSAEARVQAEALALGIDHALVGGVLLRRWALPESLVTVVERHHAAEAADHAAIVQLADLLVHHAAGEPVRPQALRDPAARLGLSDAQLRDLVYDPHRGTAGHEGRVVPEPSPLTRSEQAVIRELAAGKLYKQIALDLGVSPSTVRTHLHHAYKKLGVADRAQAVLLASARGWL
jgi:putative nucleotidyltransferase with HDIG domain